jgi:hypothetical protein
MAQWYQGQKLPVPRLAEDHQELLSEEAEHDHLANELRREGEPRDTRPWWKRLFRRPPAADEEG